MLSDLLERSLSLCAWQSPICVGGSLISMSLLLLLQLHATELHMRSQVSLLTVFLCFYHHGLCMLISRRRRYSKCYSLCFGAEKKRFGRWMALYPLMIQKTALEIFLSRADSRLSRDVDSSEHTQASSIRSQSECCVRNTT
ncbi:uncharacterized protein EDB91DRAFT_1109085 [Suillus paluster]|uniref:uncharacterized protein n=1 Tax=Suillus paluster TaxID=48578 RepID=UPI001B86F32C|nr:uncharacterized protein EDB91DRAFT_1109085 [Suillus paluster]KAG1749687.1 hypothetical protein EDB91DRAFT_1109085 [Suillus paluster]